MSEPECPCPDCSPRRRFRSYYRDAIRTVSPEWSQNFMHTYWDQPPAQPDPGPPPAPVRAKSFEKWISKTARLLARHGR